LAVVAAFYWQGAGRGPLREQAARLYQDAAAANERRLVLWLPVAMAAGIGVYFALPAEPGMVPVGFALLGLAFWIWRHLAGSRSVAATLIAMAVLGMLLAKAHVWTFSGPAIAAATEELHVEGFVEQITRGIGRSATIILRLHAAEGLTDDQRPKRIRISTAVQKDLRVGDYIAAKLRLNPLLTPVAPNAFDFARTQWLQGIGASASTRTPLRINRSISSPLWLALRRSVDAARFAIGERIRKSMPDDLGLLAVALITGERAGLPRRMKDSLQASGLAHVAVLQPGLQMSFLAVTGLLSFFETRRMERSLAPTVRRGRVIHAVTRLATAFLTLAATTVIAGICTGPPAAYHFGRVSPYSLVGNLLALPVVSSIVMPMALAGTMLMLVGLEHLPFAVMHVGLKSVMAISDWTASLPGARYFVAGQTAASAVVMSAGILHISLVLGAARWLGAVIFTIGLLLALLTPRPDVLIERTARNVAIRNGAGELVVANPRRSRFAVERWLIADGDDASPAESAARRGWRCANHVCLALVKDKRVAFAQAEAEGKLTCPNADILIAGFPLRKSCSNIPLRIDRFDVWRMGAYALFIDGSHIKTQTARSIRGARPWVIEPRARKLRLPGRSMAAQ
jgi:predicted membrane metal-binding protein